MIAISTPSALGKLTEYFFFSQPRKRINRYGIRKKGDLGLTIIIRDPRIEEKLVQSPAASRIFPCSNIERLARDARNLSCAIPLASLGAILERFFEAENILAKGKKAIFFSSINRLLRRGVAAGMPAEPCQAACG